MTAAAGRAADDARLDAAVKPGDGFFTTFLVNPYSKHVARWFARRGWSPNAVTLLSLAVAVAAAALFALGERWSLVAGAALVHVAFVLDCADGQLARYTGRLSALGAWLDSVFDRVKEYAVYAGLAIGAGDVWLLAALALAVQTVRHTVDLALARAGRPPAAAAGTESAWSWAKRVAGFPIGERFAVIAVTAALWGPQVTFFALLAGNAVGFAYVLAGRLRPGGQLAWLRAGAVRALDYGGLLAIAAAADDDAALPAAFALLAALAYGHYDLAYRLRDRRPPAPVWVAALAGRWEARLIAAVVLLVTGALVAGYFVAAGVLAAAFVASSVAGRRAPAATTNDEQEDTE